MEASVHSGVLAQISGNHICFVAWARAFHAATLLKDQCVVGISCEVAGCSQINTPGLTFSVQAYIMSNRSLLIICNVKTVLCMFCRSVRSWLQHMRVTKFRQLHTNIPSLLILFRCMVATVLCYLKNHIIHNFNCLLAQQDICFKSWATKSEFSTSITTGGGKKKLYVECI